jgi:hypothetical protein
MNAFLKGVRSGFKKFGHRVNSVVNTVVLIPVYFLGVGLTSVIGKIAKKKFMDLDPKGESYWVEVKENEHDLEYYRRSF